MNTPLMTREQYANLLYQWLPGVYRARDTQGELQRYLALFADELWRMRAGLDQRQRDHYIDSCQDWVIPYLADLVGTTVLFDDARRNRVDVKNTLHWRRQKGTLAGLEDLAAGIGGWGTHAVEMFERTAWMQNLGHIKPHARFALDVSDADAMAALNTPFASARALVDLRPATQRSGWFRPSNVAMFTWPLASYPRRHVTPAALSTGRFLFAPFGGDTALYAGGDKNNACASLTTPRADICHEHADHVPIRIRDAKRYPFTYVGTALGFTLLEDGIALTAPTSTSAAISNVPCLDYQELANDRGLIAADTSLYATPQQFRVEAARLGAVLQDIAETIDGVEQHRLVPVAYSGGQPWSAQLQLRNAHGTLALDAVTPDYAYLAGVAPYQPNSGEYHHPVLLLRLANTGVVANFPANEIIVRNAVGGALQVFLPALTNVPAAAVRYFYVAADGSTYFARGDHGAGAPDRNPDASLFGAYLAPHLARAAEGQVRLRPGHPALPHRVRVPVPRSLCCWDRPLQPPINPGEVAVDPERGRFMFPSGEVPSGRLSVSYRFGFTAEIGAGPFTRVGLAAATITVAQTRNADHSSIQAAIDAAPDGSLLPVVIEIRDSATYHEALLVNNRNFPAGLVVQAADQQTPSIVKTGGGANAWTVSNSTLGRFTLDGLTLAGGNVNVSGNVAAIRLRFCALQPDSVSLHLAITRADVSLTSCISGPIAINAASGNAVLTDSIVQHPAATVEAPGGSAALAFANGSLTLEHVTVIGDVGAHAAKVSNSLLYGALALADVAASCLRFSRVPDGFGGFRCSSAVPMFVSLTFGDAGYCHLHPNTAAALTRSAENNGETGAFYGTGIAWREQNVATRLAEYIPAGLSAVQIRVLPRLRYQGNLPL